MDVGVWSEISRHEKSLSVESGHGARPPRNPGHQLDQGTPRMAITIAPVLV